MSVLYLVMGKSASGKDTIFQRLIQDSTLNLKTIIPYTTRPKREGEQNGKEYYFLSHKQFLVMKENGKIIESRTYQTIHGDWTYFTADDGQISMDKNESYLLIGTLETYIKIREYYQKKVAKEQKETQEWLKGHIKPIYIEVEDGERLMRALQREQKQKYPKYAELCRRFLADEEDFSEEKLKLAGIINKFQNKKLKDCLEQIYCYLKYS